jgi:hypothetical protein
VRSLLLRVLVLVTVLFLLILGLNTAAAGLSSLTLQEMGPIVDVDWLQGGQVRVIWLGEPHVVNLEKILKTFLFYPFYSLS